MHSPGTYLRNRNAPHPIPLNQERPMSIGPPQSDKTDGFALLITITLLAFLVLLLVSLAALTRVETQVASNNKDLAQARQNALVALNIALGELQKYAGPDQRITARSDMDATLADTHVVSGRWTGVYGSGAPADYTMAPSIVGPAVVAASNTTGSQAKLLNWLVSGNESTAFDPASGVGATGQITQPPTAFQFTPHDAVTGLVAGVGALDSTLTIQDRNNTAHPARLLVGPATVGASLADHVAAPLRDIDTIVPGLGDDPVTVGRYAWWVGDEGAKARINLPLATAAQAPNAFVSAQRAAVELVDANNPSSSTSLTTADMLDPTGAASRYNPAHPGVPRLLSPEQLPLLSIANASAIRLATQHRYHDLSAYSTSVLADTYAGGLKKDLSALLASGPVGATGPADTDLIFPPEPNTPTDKRNAYGLPTWGQLRSFAQTMSDVDGLLPRPPGMTKIATYAEPVGTTVGIAPIMTYAVLGFQYTAPLGDAPGNPIHLALFPMVVLWNPYTTALKPSRYKVGLHRTEFALVELQGHDGPDNSAYPWSLTDVVERKNLRFANGFSDPFFRFILDNDDGIPPGQSRVFTLRNTGATYTGSNVLQADNYNQFHHALMPSTASISAAGRTYRVGINADETTHTYEGRPTSKTFFTAQEGMIGYPWNVAGKTEAYFGNDQAGVPLLDDMAPYKGSAAATRNWYQSLSYLTNPPRNAAPYGPYISFPSDPLASTRYPGTYPNAAESNKWRGLLQPPGPLGPATSPAWRMLIHARFDQSNARWLATNNPRGLVTTSMKGRGVVNFDGLEYKETTWPPLLTVDEDPPRTSAGLAPATTSALVDATLFEFRPDTQPLLSIGQLQHANLSWFSSYPAYAIGNSLGDTSFNSGPHQVVRLASQSTDPTYTNNAFSAYYDLSWLLNRALWDRYFVSTVPSPGTGTAADSTITPATSVPTTLPNPRHVRHADASDPALLRNADRAAEHLLLSGGFNINSTSEQAWRAVLGGTNRINHDPTGANVGGPPVARPVFSRFSKPTTNATTDAWQGYRQLTEEQIARFARNIVTEIRRRGPFVSLADFINRRLHHADAFPQLNDTRLKGTLQAALDSETTGPLAINPAETAPFTTVIAEAATDTPNPFRYGNTTPLAPYGSPSAFAPQFLTQADVLSTLGNGLSARSDTFVIRTYGEALNPALPSTDPGGIAARAWCEAVVQRLPEYVDATDPALNTLGHAVHPSATNDTNRHFGRRFKIISFRWLTANDI